jgi:hypothetical protein
MFLSSYNSSVATIANEAAAVNVIPYNCTISNFCFYFDRTPGAEINPGEFTGYTFTIRKNNVSASSEILAYLKKTADTSVSVPFNAGDLFSIYISVSYVTDYGMDPPLARNPTDNVNFRWTCAVTRT